MVVVRTFGSMESILADDTFPLTFLKCLTIGNEGVGVGGHVCAEEASQKVEDKIGWKDTHHNVPRHMVLACEVDKGNQVGTRPGISVGGIKLGLHTEEVVEGCSKGENLIVRWLATEHDANKLSMLPAGKSTLTGTLSAVKGSWAVWAWGVKEVSKNMHSTGSGSGSGSGTDRVGFGLAQPDRQGPVSRCGAQGCRVGGRGRQ